MDGLGELIGEGLGELMGGLSTSGGSNKKEETGCGCAMLVIILFAIFGIVYFYYEDKDKELKPHKQEFIKAKIDGMYDNDQVGVHSSRGDTLIIISHDLYLNKKVGDSINLQIK